MPAIAREPLVRHDLLDRLGSSRQRTDDLFAIVNSDALYERPIAERHRIIFYIGHLEAFDWNLLRERAFGLKSFHPEFDRLFAFGIDPVGGGLPSDRPADWPAISQVKQYVEKIRGALDEKLSDAFDDPPPLNGGFPLPILLNVAIEHRLMHAETLAYMLHQLPLNRKQHRAEPREVNVPPISHRSMEIPSGRVTLGLPRASEVFGWDNEYEEQAVEVPAFAIDRYMVTNRQFLEFIHAGGYETKLFWAENDNDADWSWKQKAGISHPAFWKPEGNRWLYRAMFAEVPLPLDWPVYVSQAEAKAYARWAGKSLPTEAEWQRAAYCTPSGEQQSYPWGEQTPDAGLGNFDFSRWSPVAVNAFPRAVSALGVHGMLGNGWEWTSTEFAPFPGFEPFSFYRGYSADFFDGKHFVMKGGSARTSTCMLRRSFRNWFQARYQYVYAGFRCVNR